MYKVLVCGMSSNYGGIENIIINLYRNFSKDKIRLDFINNSHNPIAYEKELKGMKSKIYYLPSKFKYPYFYKKNMKKFFKKNACHYDCIWVNRNDLANLDYLKYAKKYGISKRIIHGHNVSIIEKGLRGKIKYLYHFMNRNVVQKYATDFWACSDEAGKWFYPKRLLDKVVIIKNAIDIKKFKFNLNKRNQLRNELNLHHDFVIGNVGRLDYQKNQSFAIKVVAEIKKFVPNTKLVLVGQGKNKTDLEKLAQDYKIRDSVLFVGMKKNVEDWYSLFDIFIFPSLFEGLGIAGIEAQANGLNCVVSSNDIPYSLKINDNFYFMDLREGPQIWAKKICNLRNKKRLSEKRIVHNFIKEGYELQLVSKKVQKRLLS